MLTVAISGCGLITTMKYLPIFQKLKDQARIVGLCDLNADALKKASLKFGISNTYTDFSQMLTSRKPDMVVVCTPPATHAKIVREALEKGSHVLVEKPMALTAADCEQMIETSKKHGKKLGVMHNQLFNPAFQKACEIVSSGKVGTFLGMRIFLMTSVHDMTEDQKHWAHRLPGGLVGETGPHAVYLSTAFLEHITDVNVVAMKHCPQYPWCIGEDIRFDIIAENGISSVALMYGSNQTAAEVDIICTKGYLKVDLQTRIVTVHNRLQDSSIITAGAVTKSVMTDVLQTSTQFIKNGFQYVFSRNIDGHYIGVKRFLDYISGKVDFPATGDKGREVEETMESLVEKLQHRVVSSKNYAHIDSHAIL